MLRKITQQNATRNKHILAVDDNCFIGDDTVVEGFLVDIKSSTLISIPTLRQVAGTLCHQYIQLSQSTPQ